MVSIVAYTIIQLKIRSFADATLGLISCNIISLSAIFRHWEGRPANGEASQTNCGLHQKLSSQSSVVFPFHASVLKPTEQYNFDFKKVTNYLNIICKGEKTTSIVSFRESSSDVLTDSEKSRSFFW